MDTDPLPLLLWDDISNAAADRSSRLSHGTPVFKEVLQGRGWGGDTEKAGCLRAPDTLDSGGADALAVEGPVDSRYDVFDSVSVQREAHIVRQLEAPLVHRCLGGR